MKMKKVLALALAGAMLLGLAACGENGEQSSSGGNGNSSVVEENKGGKDVIQDSNEKTGIVTETTEATGERLVRVGISGDPVDFSPWQGNSVGRTAVLNHIYQRLAPLYINPETGVFQSYNAMITGYDHVPDSLEYTIHLREGIVDTAGNKIEASDVKFSYEKAAESGYFSSATSISEIEIIDPLTFVFKFDEALPVGTIEDVLGDIYVVSQASYEASSDGMISDPVGSTGYVLSDYKAGSSATITKAEREYWNEAANQSESEEDGFCSLYDTRNVDTIEFEFITEASTMAISLEKGEIDIATTISNADVTLFEEGGADADDFNLWVFPADALGIAANMSPESPMSNINLRKAVFYSFDNSSIIQACYGQYSTVCYSWNTVYRGEYDPKYENSDYFNYNAETAKEYLEKYYEETGTTLDDLHIVLLVSNQSEYQKAAQFVQLAFCEVAGSDDAMTLSCVDDSIFTSSKQDPTAFDLVVDAEASEALYSCATWRKSAWAPGQANGMAMFFNDDPKLQELLEAACAESTFSQETTNAFDDYVTEMAYRKLIGTGASYRVAANWVGRILKAPKAGTNICGMKFDWAAKEAAGK